MSKIQLFDSVFRYKSRMTNWLVLALILVSSFSFAQTVPSYGFSQSEGTYTELTNPTVIAEATAQTGLGSIDDQVYTINDLPFQIEFNGQSYTSLNVFANGFLSFGTETLNNSQPISSSVAYEGVISPLTDDLAALYNVNGKTGNISLETIGTAPNRELVIQWKNFTKHSSMGYASDRYELSFQARLHENGTVVFVYDNAVAAGSPLTFYAKVGLRGASSSVYNIRSSSGTSSSNWNSTVAGTSNTAGVYTNTLYLPTSGLTFTWTPPSGCITPTAQPTDLQLSLANPSSIIINGSFTASNPAADRYLILRNLSGVTPNTPVDGTVYTVGQNADLNAYVVHYGTNTTFENNYNNGIVGNNEYVYTIYSVSSDCTGGPLYLLTNPLSESITNCPISLNGITAGTTTTTSFVLSWPVGENGNSLPMSRVIEVATDEDFTNMVTGSPFTLSASDLSLTVSGLSANTQYYYRGKNTTSLCESAYSTVGSIYTACVAISDFSENFDTAPTVNFTIQLPNCWSKILTGTGSSTPTISVTPTYHNSAPNGVTFYGNGADMTDLENKAILVSPMLTNVGDGTHRLRFQAKMSSSGGTYDLQVVALSSNTADATIEVIETIAASQLSPDYQEFSVNFNNYSGTADYIGLRRINGSSYSYLCVDDVVWEAIPSCPELPSITASNPTVDGATISWEDTLGTPANGYEYFVSASNTLPAETETFETTTASPLTITGLTNGTHYVFVRRACDSDDKSPWRQTSFSTVPTSPAPWLEEFLTSTFPQGWTNGPTGQTFNIGTAAGYPGNPGMNLHKNLYASYATGTFTTIAVGPLTADNYELSFDYRQGAYSSPYTPLDVWGNFTIEVSDDFGATWTQIGIVEDEAGTGDYIHKTYSLEDYENEYVQVRISATRTAGDYYLSFDNFAINLPGEEDPFCLPVYEYNADGNMITQVIFNTIDQTSPFTSGTTPEYEDFTDVSTDIEQGSTHQISVKGPSSTFPSDVMVYIDFNQNGDFSDDGTGFYIGRLEPANPANAFTITSDITIPNDVLTGTTKMRIVKNTNVAALSDPNAPNSISGPCADDLRSGQVEDYSLNITEGIPAVCLGEDPSETVGDTGCVSFTYNGATVEYTTVRATDGNIWLQQNLGSDVVAATMDDEDSYGDLFQWGRWADGHQKRDSETTSVTPTPNNPVGITPGLDTFIINSWWSGNALTDQWTAPDVDSVNEANGCDPCKALGEGWQLPSQDDWTTLVDSENFNNPAGAFASTLKLPANGYRSSSDGGFTFVGERGYYWSSTPTGIGGKYLYVGTTLANPAAGAMRGQGAAIRCVKLTQTNQVVSVEVTTENNVPAEITTENGTLQLVATVNPADVEQEVIWSVVSGDDFASVDSDGLVTAIANGTATVRATSVEDETIFGDIEIVVDIEEEGTECEAVETFLETFETFTTFPENCWNANYTNYAVGISDETVQLYSGGASGDNIIIISPEVSTIDGQHVLAFDMVSISQAGTTVQVGTMTDNTDFSTFSAVGEAFAPTAGTTHTTAAIPANAGHKYVAIRYSFPPSSHIVLKLDNIEWKEVTSGTDEFDDRTKVTVYPNPTNGMVTIESSEIIDRILLFDITGKQILNQNSNRIDLAKFPAGIYFARIYFENSSIITEKIIKQ